MKAIYCLMILFCPVVSFGQTPKALTIGDSLPPMPGGAIINYKAPAATLANFKNELVILDFWSTWCVPCVKALPAFEALQQKFGGKVQFVLATPQEKETIRKFLQQKKIGLPCFLEDKVLLKYFPHNSVPHEVWIKEGRVVAVTYAEEVSEENIRKVLEGRNINLVEKKAVFDYDISQPLLVAGNGGNANDLLYHSVITGYLDGIPDGGGVMTDSVNRYKIRVIDGSIARLYATAARQYSQDYMLPNRTIIEANEPEKINPSSNPQYTPAVRKYFYSYELAIPAAAKADAGRFMMEDLNRYFGMVYHISAAIENRKVLCWVLRKEAGPLVIATKHQQAGVTEKDGCEIWVNQPFATFFYALAYINRKQPHPFVDRTGITAKVDLVLPLDMDVPALQSYLKKYQLRLSQEECVIPMLVIKNIH